MPEQDDPERQVDSGPPAAPTQPGPTAGPAVPGIITALVILLYVGAAMLLLSALAMAGWRDVESVLRAVEYLAFAGLYALLAWKIRRARRWARLVLVILCGWGILTGVLYAAGNPAGAAYRLATPVAYLILLSTRGAREWFRRPATPPPAEQVGAPG